MNLLELYQKLPKDLANLVQECIFVQKYNLVLQELNEIKSPVDELFVTPSYIVSGKKDTSHIFYTRKGRQLSKFVWYEGGKGVRTYLKDNYYFELACQYSAKGLDFHEQMEFNFKRN